MKKIKVLCVGKASKDFCRDGCNEYLKRLKGFYDVTVSEIPEQPTLKKECDELLRRMSGCSVLMDVKGKAVSSEELADMVKTEHERGDELTFVIGGASGVDERVRAAAKHRVSFGAVTYPHQLVRVLLLEQLYRAATIINRIPYHK
ncbi:MAG: 23S rRNA (pseudouridine(1915)-N(3))-methyltransferase RlmH [Clostridia bacterium]|nr:23S rRNA (pseudouridine(1915)-N(3))-methyltransferase RlmH [Clostridia bacterium]